MSDPRLPSLTPATKKDNPALRILAYIHFGSGGLESWNVSFSVGVASVEALVCSTIVSVCVWVLMMEWNMIIWFLGITTSWGSAVFQSQQEAAIRPGFAKRSSISERERPKRGEMRSWRFLARGLAEHEVEDHYISQIKGNLRVIKTL